MQLLEAKFSNPEFKGSTQTSALKSSTPVDTENLTKSRSASDQKSGIRDKMPGLKNESAKKEDFTTIAGRQDSVVLLLPLLLLL